MLFLADICYIVRWLRSGGWGNERWDSPYHTSLYYTLCIWVRRLRLWEYIARNEQRTILKKKKFCLKFLILLKIFNFAFSSLTLVLPMTTNRQISSFLQTLVKKQLKSKKRSCHGSILSSSSRKINSPIVTLNRQTTLEEVVPQIKLKNTFQLLWKKF